ncbi:tape measure protein [Micavibrio aeruginosavorus]|uniref:tape measure protein n=1 Tax=Micavibrio aeruginosavorus TaxID=349221 RepID=UPI003F4A9001
MSGRSLNLKLILEAVDKMTAPINSMMGKFLSSMKKMQDAAKKVSESMTKIGESMRKVGGDMTLSISAPLAAIGTMAVKQSANFEKLKASLKSVTGSQEAANAAFDDMLAFSTSTPFQLEEVMGAYIKLKALGLDPSRKSLESFGNTASAMGKSLDQFIEAVADASTGEFERLKEFGIKARTEGNKISFTFQGQKTTVKNNAEAIQGYLRSIGEVKFAGAMEEQMKTMNGAFSNFSDSVSTSLAKVGDEIIRNLDLKEFTIGVSNQIAALADAFKSLPEPMQGFIIKGGLILAIVGPLIAILGQFVIGMASMVIAMSFVAPAFIPIIAGLKALGIAFLTTPFGWFVAGVMIVAGAALLIYKNWGRITTFFGGIWGGIKKAFADGVAAVMDFLSPLINAINFVRDGIGKAKAFMTGTSSVGGTDSPQASTSAPFIAPAPMGGMQVNQKVDTGGTLRIKIDADGQAHLVESRPNDRRMEYATDTGLLMGAM